MNNPFIQREISWNAFNARVLNEGLRSELALLDRLQFMAITSSNYDEFFMVRVSRLLRKIDEGDKPLSPVGERPSKILEHLLQDIREIVNRQDEAMTCDILPALEKEGLAIIPPDRWGRDEIFYATQIFNTEIFPLCTPMALTDSLHLRNQIAQGRIYACFITDDDRITIIRVPDNVQRFWNFCVSTERHEIMLIEDILLSRGEHFLPGAHIQSRCIFRLTRDADMDVNEERDEDFIAAIEEVLEYRKTGFPVRLETSGDTELAEKIRQLIHLPQAQCFHLSAPLNLKDFSILTKNSDFKHLRTALPTPKVPEDINEHEDIWETLKMRDVLLHHPYETFMPVVRMVEKAAVDLNTLAIKMTLYRTSGESPIISALIQAAKRGVQVTVVVEIKARFDEGANISWASRLEAAGAIVIYGLAVLKVHAKILIVVRREDTGVCRYLHMSTGNYNDSTAKLYTDMGLMTSREEFTSDAALFFNAITGYSMEPQFQILHMAPFSLRSKTLHLIRREIERAKTGEEARIVAKMNALVDPEIIMCLYSASQAGVMVDLNIRGICCLRPGVKGLSENIHVVSIIDRFLEHMRAFSYHNGGENAVFLSSADWMTRNLDRRVELLFPVLEATHKHRINRILRGYFKDNTRAWELRPNGQWTPRKMQKDEYRFRIQETLAQNAASISEERFIKEHRTLKVRRVPKP